MSDHDEDNRMNAEKMNDDNEQRDSRRNRKIRDGKSNFRFLISSRDAGAIIGKGGKTIQDLRLKHQCQIQVADCQVPERVLVINGDPTDVLNCVSDILSSISESHQRSNKPDQNEVRALIHQSQAGALIGKAASKIKEFREKHNIDIKVYPQCCPGGSTERCISMRGNKSDVLRCLSEVYSVLQNVPPRGSYRYYDPSTYDGYNVIEYGGYSDSSVGYHQSNPRVNNVMRYPKQSYGSSSQTYSKYNDTFEDNSYNRNRNRASGFNSGHQQYESMTTTQVTIPTEMAGVIIGAKGSKISQIRHESGASIKIDSEPMNGTNDRLITITGYGNQIQQALFLLQETVRQSGVWNE